MVHRAMHVVVCGACLILSGAALLVGCQPMPAQECRWTEECPSGEFCRLGSCVALAGPVDTGRHSKETGGTTPGKTVIPDGGDRSGDGASNESGSTPSPSCPDGRRPDPDDLALNEILVHVPTGPSGDANGDGTRDPFDDEFVELVNTTDHRLDLADVRLIESGEEVTNLQGVCLDSGAAIVIFGGTAEASSPQLSGGVRTMVSPQRFGFANSGGSFRVVASKGGELAALDWSSAPAESYTLAPQIRGESYRPHSELQNSKMMSPGRCVDGSPLEGGCPPASSTDAGDAVGDGADATP